VVTFDDVTAQKRYEETLRFLSEASRELAESIDYEATLAQIARLAVPGIADWFSVDMLRDGEICSLFVAHGDPAKMELAREFRRRFPSRLDAPRGVARVLREGQPELFEDISDERLAAGAQSAEHLAMMRQLDMRSAMIVPLHVRGRTVGAISFVTTGSGRRYDRRDLEVAQGFADRAAVAIENARLFRDAERAIRLREQVLAVVSHDLRNPLTSINMSATILSKKLAAGAPARRQVEAVERAARRMDRLIGDLLDTASIHAGRLAIEPSPQELVPTIHEATQLAEPLARERGLELSSEISLDEVRCNIDRERVLQLFSNLFGNAIKFCPTGSIITVRAKVSGNEVENSVSDTGPGIPETDLPHIFDPYWSARHAKNGTGLGLFISKGIVETHGGRIWAESRPGDGATFRFTLPLA
jgi:signal transduction histidine kinase